MKLYYHTYELNPLGQLNAVHTAGKKIGLYLKLKLDNNEEYYSDYFPHTELGDTSVSELLKSNTYLTNRYFMNTLVLALKVRDITAYKSIKNHRLLNAGKSKSLSKRDLRGDVVKIKLKSTNDFKFVEALSHTDTRIRLDANGSFSLSELNGFLSKVNYQKIDYIEDPSFESDWDKLCVPTASDFILNDKANFRIIKPNRSIEGANQSSIISSYMGSDLGRVLAYKFLLKFGNLSLTHGILTPNIYQEQNELLFTQENLLSKSEEAKLYQGLSLLDWHELKINASFTNLIKDTSGYNYEL